MIRNIIISFLFLSFFIEGIAQTVLELPRIDIAGNEYYEYVVEKDESLYGIAKKFGWDVKELMKTNPSAKGSLKKGLKLYYPILNEDEKQKTNITDPSNLNNIRHTVRKGETVYSISHLYDIPLETIYQYNPDSKKGIKAGQTLIISNLFDENGSNTLGSGDKPEEEDSDTSKLDITYVSEEPIGDFNETMDQTSVQDLFEVEENEKLGEIKLALLLSDPTSKKDIDFTRGVLLTLSEMKNSSIPINFKVLDGSIPSEEICGYLEEFSPTVVITTADKTFPEFLLEYGDENNIPIVNVFDLKSNLIENHQTLIQVLPPSLYFYENMANEVYNENRHRKLILVGENDENDGMATELKNLFGKEVEIKSLEEFGAMQPDIMQSVLIYTFANRKEEIFDFFNNIEHLTENFPGFDYHILGRTSWIAHIDDLGNKFNTYSVAIPVRVWVDEDASDWKNFSKEYERMFHSIPVRSIPSYSASGYDISKYLLNSMSTTLSNDIDLISGQSQMNALQNNMKLNKISSDGGYLNNIGYLVRFYPGGGKEKIMVK